MSTLETLKAEAAKLPAAERNELANWIARSEDVEAVRRAALLHDLRAGMEQAEQGELKNSDEVFTPLRAYLSSL